MIWENCFPFPFPIGSTASCVKQPSQRRISDGTPLSTAVLTTLGGSYNGSSSWSYSTSVFANRNSEKPCSPDGETNVLRIKRNFILMF